MTKATTDRRVERTRVALLHAFVDLVLRDGFEAVTVEAVADHANVGRSTFYMHFRGKDDILKYSMAVPNRELACVLDENTTAAHLVPILEHFYEQRRKNRVFFEAPVRGLWTRHLADMLEPQLMRRRSSAPLLPVPLVAYHLAELQIGLLARWLLGRHPLKPAAVAEAILASVRAGAAALLPG